MVYLNNVWYVIIAIFWVGFFILEGFDFGVGMLHSFVGKDDMERRIVVNSIGPIWDGNEVWLIVAGAAMFAAFPSWYATMFSTFYLALVIVLLGSHRARRLLRVPPEDRRPTVAVYLEVVAHSRKPLRSPPARHSSGRPPPWAADQLLPQLHRQLLGSPGSVRALHRSHRDRSLPVRRCRLPDAQDRRSAAPTGGSSVGPTRVGGRRHHLRLADVASCRNHSGFVPKPIEALAFVAVVGGAGLAEARAEGWAFAGAATAVGSVVASIFFELFPRVMVSSTKSAYNLTVANSSSNSYSLKVMTVVAVIFFPLILLYQGWSLYIFRKRIGGGPPAVVAAPVEPDVPPAAPKQPQTSAAGE